MDKGQLGIQDIMNKYISTLENLAPRFGSENFLVYHLNVRKDGGGSSSFSHTTHAQGVSKDSFEARNTHEIMVTGTEGVQWRKLSSQKVCQDLKFQSRDLWHCLHLSD